MSMDVLNSNILDHRYADGDHVSIDESFDNLNFKDEPSKHVFIRHAEKQYKNGKANIFSHDPAIVDGQKLNIQALVNNLKRSHGNPDLIITSPYLRCRQTTQEIVKCLNVNVPIRIDNRISEFLGHHKSQDVHHETMKHNPPHPEIYKQFEGRVMDFYMSVSEDNRNIWIISHGIVMKTIFKLKRFGVRPPSFKCLESISM